MRSLFVLLFTLSSILITAQNNLPDQKSSCEIDLGPDLTVCNNAQFTLNPAAPAGGDYQWTGSPGLSCYDCPSPEVSGLTTGVYIYIATFTTPDCSMSDTIRITVISGQAPQYEIADDQHICLGDSISLGGAAVPGTFYNWFSVPPGFVNAGANPKVKPIVATKYYLSVSNASCPLLTLDSVTITPVDLTLQLTPATDEIHLCKGDSRLFQATVTPAGPAVNWSPTSGLQVGPGGATALASPDESTLYTASVSFNGCTRTKKVLVAVDSLPDDLRIKPADTTICQGAKVILVSPYYQPAEYKDITFKWSPATGTLTPDSLFNMVVQPTQTTIYRRITRNGLCTDTAIAVVKVIPLAQMTVMPSDTSVCPGRSVEFHLTYTPGVTNIKWEPAVGLSCTDCDNPIASPGSTQTYKISGTFQGCSVGTAATLNIFPLAPIQFPADRQLCAGQSVTLNEVFDGSTYTWTSTDPGFGVKITGNPTYIPPQTATYFVTAVTQNGCVRSDSVQIAVNSATLTTEGDTTICKNFSTPIKALANVQGSFQWRNDATGQIIGTNQGITVMPDVTTTYTAIFTFAGDCQLTAPVTVTIKGEAPQIVPPSDLQACPGDSITLNLGPVLAGSVYNWSAIPPDPTLKPTAAAPTVYPTVDTKYTVTAVLGDCPITQTIDVIAHHATLNLSSDTTVCDGTKATLTATGSAPNGSYLWSTGDSGASIAVAPAANTTYTVTYAYGDGCELEDSVRVNWVKNFNVSIQSFPIKDTINVGEMLTLTAVVTPPTNLSNFDFTWQEVTIDTKDLPSHTETIDVVPSSNDTSTKSIIYKLIAVSPEGCLQDTIRRFYLVFPLVRFPNAFTPDGDGNNDAFKMIVPKGLAYISRMQIFNRWGQRVFESTEPNAVWDGNVDGKEAPTDVYVYYVWWRRGDDALQVQATGEVTLLR